MPDLLRPRAGRPVLVTAGLSAFLGLTVLTGWFTHTAPLVQIRQGMEPTWPNGGLCFLLLGAALLLSALGHPKTTAICIAAVLVVAGLTAVEYLFGTDLGIDRLLVQPFLPIGRHPGRMAANPMVLFLLSGIAVALGPARQRRPVGVAILGTLILSNALIAITGYLAGLPTWGFWELTHMPPLAAIGFTTLGAGFLIMAWHSEAPGEYAKLRWLPAIAAIFSLAATLYLWQGLQAAEYRHVEAFRLLTAQLGDSSAKARLMDALLGEETPLPEFALCLGLVLSALLVAAIYFAQAAGRRRSAAERANAGREKAERRLGVTEEQSRLALEAAEMGTCSWDDAGSELIWDSRAKVMLGQTAEAPLDYAAFLNLVHPEDRDHVRRAIEAPVLADRFIVEFRVAREDRDIRWIAFRGRPKGQAVAIDVTERKLAEQALSRSRNELESLVEERTREITEINHELEAFSYSVSHDLRAPLRHIDGYSRILLSEAGDQLNESARKRLDRIRHATTQMVRMIDELLEFSRMGRKELDRRPTGLRSLVDESLELLKPAMEGREIDWRIGPLPSLECDPRLVEHVTVNLLSNAIKFTRGKTPAIIEVGQMSENGVPAIYVRDNGVGFDMKFADKLFGIFQRLHRREDYEGVGVGLAMVQRIVHKHGGRIWAESEPGKGTTFYFTLTETPAILK